MAKNIRKVIPSTWRRCGQILRPHLWLQYQTWISQSRSLSAQSVETKRKKVLLLKSQETFYFLKYCSIITDIIILYGTHISHPEAKKCQLHNLLYQCRLKINTYEKKLPPRISGLLSSQVQAFSLRFTVIP